MRNNKLMLICVALVFLYGCTPEICPTQDWSYTVTGIKSLRYACILEIEKFNRTYKYSHTGWKGCSVITGQEIIFERCTVFDGSCVCPSGTSGIPGRRVR